MRLEASSYVATANLLRGSKLDFFEKYSNLSGDNVIKSS